MRTRPLDVVGFDLTPWGHGLHHLTPAVNGVSLVELVSAYEVERDYEPANGYDGIVWGLIKLYDLSGYLLGRQGYPRSGLVQLLSCECGEWGCWPLQARLVTNDGLVTWDTFVQPHRPGRDYSGFGPLVFDVDQYGAAVADIVAALTRDADPDLLVRLQPQAAPYPRRP